MEFFGHYICHELGTPDVRATLKGMESVELLDWLLYFRQLHQLSPAVDVMGTMEVVKRLRDKS